MGAVATVRARHDPAGGGGIAVPAVRSTRLRTGRLPLPELDSPGAGRRDRDKMPSPMTNAVALDAPHPLRSDRYEHAGFVALVGIAAALQFSIDAAQILLTI